jgi:hypothetical protein
MKPVTFLLAASCLAAWVISQSAQPRAIAAGGIAPKATPATSSAQSGQVQAGGDKLEAMESAGIDERAARDLEVEKKLRTRLEKIQFKNTTLSDFIDGLKKSTGLDILVKWPPLETAGIEPNAMIRDAQFGGGTAETALRFFLDHIGATVYLGYAPNEGSLIVSTADDLASLRYRTTLYYDVRDIIPPPGEKEVPSAGGIFGGIFGAAGSQNTQNTQNEDRSPRAKAIKELCYLIARVVDRDSWMDPWGTGTVGTMVEYGGMLVINQTWENHRQIAALLARTGRRTLASRTVTICATWLALDDKQIAQIVPDAGAKRTVPLEVNPDAIKGLEAAYRGETTGLEGQALQIAAGRGQSALVNALPVVSDNVVACQPVINVVFWGAMFEGMAVVATEGNSASINFRSVVTQPKDLGAIPFAPFTAATATAPVVFPRALDRLDFSVWSAGAIMRVPLGKPILVGGMSGPDAKGKHLYLVLEMFASKPSQFPQCVTDTTGGRVGAIPLLLNQ